MSKIKRIGINMVSGAAGYMVPMLINVLSMPYVIDKLGKQAYGLQAIANVVIGYLIVADLGLDIPITRKIAEFHAKGQPEEQSNFLVGTLKIYIAIGLGGLLLVLAGTSLLIRSLSIPAALHAEARVIFALTGVGFLASIVNMWGKAVFSAIQRYDIANSISIFNNFFGITAGVFLISQGYGVVGFFAARIVGFLLANVANLFMARRLITQVTWRPFFPIGLWHYLKKQIGYGFSLRMSGMVLSKADQAIISSFIGIAFVTVYAVPILIANTLSGLIASVMHFVFPMASAMSVTHAHEEIEHFFGRITKFINALSSLLFIPFLALGDIFLGLWVDPGLALQGKTTLLLLLAAFYSNACTNIALNSFMVGLGEMKIFTYYANLRSVSLFLGFLLLIKPLGIEGAAVSYLISLVADVVFFFYSLRQKLKFDIGILLKNSYFKPITVGLVLGVVMWTCRPYVTNWYSLFGAWGVFFLAYTVCAWKWIISGEEKQVIARLLKR